MHVLIWTTEIAQHEPGILELIFLGLFSQPRQLLTKRIEGPLDAYTGSYTHPNCFEYTYCLSGYNDTSGSAETAKSSGTAGFPSSL